MMLLLSRLRDHHHGQNGGTKHGSRSRQRRQALVFLVFLRIVSWWDAVLQCIDCHGTAKRLPWSSPHTPEHAKVARRACGFCCRMRKLNSFHKLVFWGLSLMTAFPGHLTCTQSAMQESRPQNWCFTSYIQAIDPHGKKAIFRLSDSARFAVCCFSNHPVQAVWSTRSTSGALEKGRSMPGRCSSSRWCLTADRKIKADSLISFMVPTTGHHHPTLSPTICFGVTPGET